MSNSASCVGMATVFKLIVFMHHVRITMLTCDAYHHLLESRCASKVGILATVLHTYTYTTRSYTHHIICMYVSHAGNMTVQKLRGLVQRLFKVDSYEQTISYFSRKVSQ